MSHISKLQNEFMACFSARMKLLGIPRSTKSTYALKRHNESKRQQLISHVFIGITDHTRAHDFYSAIMNELGYVQKFCDPEKSWSGWVEQGVPRPLVVIGKPFNGEPMSVGNGQMVALLAKSRKIVDTAYAKAMAMGARCEGPPGLRPHYHPNYYGAYFRDLDGNKICVCCHESEG